MPDPWVRPTSPGPPDPEIVFRSENDLRPASGKTHTPDDYLLIDRLREDAASGRMDLDSILSEATHGARYFTDATGAALALWSQGVVICRARSGDTAPPLGAKLDVDSGISGECLRSGRSKRCNDTLTDPLVDSEVCQELGIRSLAADERRARVDEEQAGHQRRRGTPERAVEKRVRRRHGGDRGQIALQRVRPGRPRAGLRLKRAVTDELCHQRAPEHARARRDRIARPDPIRQPVGADDDPVALQHDPGEGDA